MQHWQNENTFDIISQGILANTKQCCFAIGKHLFLPETTYLEMQYFLLLLFNVIKKYNCRFILNENLSCSFLNQLDQIRRKKNQKQHNIGTMTSK